MMQFPKINWQITLLTISLITAFALGSFAGVIFERIEKLENRPPIEVVKADPERIPLIHFERIENGIMYGQTGEMELRFVVGKDAIYPSSDGKFQFPVAEILPMLKQIPSPEGVLFVASKRGKRYWALDAPEAFLLAEKNRIFFASEEEAVSAGYKKGGE